MKKIVFFVITISSLFIINNLVHSIYNLWQKQDLMVKAKTELEAYPTTVFGVLELESEFARSEKAGAADSHPE